MSSIDQTSKQKENQARVDTENLSEILNLLRKTRLESCDLSPTGSNSAPRELSLIQTELNRLKRQTRGGAAAKSKLTNRESADSKDGNVDPQNSAFQRYPRTPAQKSKTSLSGFSSFGRKKNAEKEDRARIKAEFNQELAGIGTVHHKYSEKVRWAFEVFGANTSDHEDELKAIYRYLIKKSHPDALQNKQSTADQVLFDKVTEAWAIFKDAGIVK